MCVLVCVLCAFFGPWEYMYVRTVCMILLSAEDAIVVSAAATTITSPLVLALLSSAYISVACCCWFDVCHCDAIFIDSFHSK